MTHQDARDRFEELRRGTLPEAEAREVEAHLASCPACREERERDDRLAARLGGLPRPVAPAGLRRRVVSQAAPGPLRRWLGRPVVAASLAAAVILLAVGVWLGRPADPVERLLRSGVAEHRRVLLELGSAPAPVDDPGPLFAHVRTTTEIQLPPVMAGIGELRLLTAQPTWLGDRKAALAALRYPTSPTTTYFVMAGRDLAVPDKYRVQIDRYRPYMREVGGYQCVYWKQGDVAYLMVSGLDAEKTRGLYLKMRQNL